MTFVLQNRNPLTWDHFSLVGGHQKIGSTCTYGSIPYLKIPPTHLNNDITNQRSVSLGSYTANKLKQKLMKNGLTCIFKKVKWADECGGTLAAVVDKGNVEFGLYDDDSSPNDQNSDQGSSFDFVQTDPVNKDTSTAIKNKWVLAFRSPAYSYGKFKSQLDNFNVCLEYVILINKDRPRLLGTIKVKNLSFDKCVFIRLSADDWASFVDFSAKYKPFSDKSQVTAADPAQFVVNYLDYCPTRKDSAEIFHPKIYDTFEFDVDIGVYNGKMDNEENTIVNENATKSQRPAIQFCICYRKQDGMEFWDNNSGSNYKIIKQKSSRKATTESRNGLRPMSRDNVEKSQNDQQHLSARNQENEGVSLGTTILGAVG